MTRNLDFVFKNHFWTYFHIGRNKFPQHYVCFVILFSHSSFISFWYSILILEFFFFYFYYMLIEFYFVRFGQQREILEKIKKRNHCQRSTFGIVHHIADCLTNKTHSKATDNNLSMHTHICSILYARFFPHARLTLRLAFFSPQLLL